MSSPLKAAREVADAVMHEGFLLYPYRDTALKNQARFQFGVLMPPAYLQVDPSEPSASQTECLLECARDAVVGVVVRHLRLRRRVLEAAAPDGFRVAPPPGPASPAPFDEACEREHELSLPMAELLAGGSELRFALPGEESSQPAPGGRVVRRLAPVSGVIRVDAATLPGPYGGIRLRLRIENDSAADGPVGCRADGLRQALIAAHALIHVPGGRFLSLADPPEWAAPHARACVNVGLWPVLAGPPGCREVVLSSPVILPDHPQVAPESPGPTFDCTEIDELLALRTLTLTDQEKLQVRRTDPRAAALLDRAEGLPAERLDRLHGAVRWLRAESAPAPPAPPDEGEIVIGGTPVGRGSRVRMRPGARRADAQDLFLAGRTAVVEAILRDLDGNIHLALTPEDDPAADLDRARGRFRYFAPEEVEPLPGR